MNSSKISEKITVMLVDDSAVIRGGLSRILEDDPSISVIASKPNGQQAVDTISTLKPDIVLLDVEMPVMDGISALPLLLKNCPTTKIIMVSTMTEKGAAVTLKALELGAVEALVKPQSGTGTPGSEFQRTLIHLIKGLAPQNKIRAIRQTLGEEAATTVKSSVTTQAPGMSVKRNTITNNPNFSLNTNPAVYKGIPKILAIGSSTGGPQALQKVVPYFKGFNIPIVITQHMPATFTKILAQHLQTQSGIPVHEGEQNMVIKPGEIYVAPGGYHMKLVQKGTDVLIDLWDGPQINFCKPAVDPMFETAIDIYGNKVLGLMLTGMGHDGLGGGRKLHSVNGRFIAQDEKTSVVWGMPGAVASENLCTEVLPLEEIGPKIKSIVTGS